MGEYNPFDEQLGGGGAATKPYHQVNHQLQTQPQFQVPHVYYYPYAYGPYYSSPVVQQRSVFDELNSILKEKESHEQNNANDCTVKELDLIEVNTQKLEAELSMLVQSKESLKHSNNTSADLANKLLELQELESKVRESIKEITSMSSACAKAWNKLLKKKRNKKRIKRLKEKRRIQMKDKDEVVKAINEKWEADTKALKDNITKEIEKEKNRKDTKFQERQDRRKKKSHPFLIVQLLQLKEMLTNSKAEPSSVVRFRKNQFSKETIKLIDDAKLFKKPEKEQHQQLATVAPSSESISQSSDQPNPQLTENDLFQHYLGGQVSGSRLIEIRKEWDRYLAHHIDNVSKQSRFTTPSSIPNEFVSAGPPSSDLWAMWLTKNVYDNG